MIPRYFEIRIYCGRLSGKSSRGPTPRIAIGALSRNEERYRNVSAMGMCYQGHITALIGRSPSYIPNFGSSKLYTTASPDTARCREATNSLSRLRPAVYKICHFHLPISASIIYTLFLHILLFPYKGKVKDSAQTLTQLEPFPAPHPASTARHVHGRANRRRRRSPARPSWRQRCRR